MHKIIINEPVWRAEEELILGNGDLSVCCYQRPGQLVFNIGKGDFWDRTIDFSKDPKPAHIQELKDAVSKRLIEVDGVTMEANFRNATPRLREICKSIPSGESLLPCPKSADTLALQQK